MLKTFRLTHRYLGIFISPALIFFAFTGAIQTFGLHETTQGSNYKPSLFLQTLGQIHKKQTWVVPVRKPQPAGATPASAPSTTAPSTASPASAPSPASPAAPGADVPHHKHDEAPSHDAGTSAASTSGPTTLASHVTPPPAPSVPPSAKRSHLPLKIFFLLVSIGLFISTITGIYMAYKFESSKWLVTALLVAGAILPLALLPY